MKKLGKIVLVTFLTITCPVWASVLAFIVPIGFAFALLWGVVWEVVSDREEKKN